MASRMVCATTLLTVVCGTGCTPDSLPERAETVSTPKRVSIPAAGVAKVSLAETLAETEHIVIIVNTVEEQPAQQLTLRKAEEVRALVTATRASLRPTTRATGYPRPSHFVDFVARDGTRTRAIVALDEGIISLPEPGRKASVDRVMTRQLKTTLAAYLSRLDARVKSTRATDG